jgi:hypothetical protein
MWWLRGKLCLIFPLVVHANGMEINHSTEQRFHPKNKQKLSPVARVINFHFLIGLSTLEMWSVCRTLRCIMCTTLGRCLLIIYVELHLVNPLL